MSDNSRSVGLNIRRRVTDLYVQIAGLKAAADSWTLDDDDLLLPSDATMKTAVEAYEAITVAPLRLFEEIQEIKAGESEPLPELPPVPVNVNTEWAAIQNKPSTFPHDEVTWSEVTGKPSVFTPDTHAHAYADITSKPSMFPGNVAFISFVGNGNSSRTLSFTGGFIMKGLTLCTDAATPKAYIRWVGVDVSASEANSFTLTSATLNASGTTYNAMIVG